jgi:Fur family transcriptional regulator, ferric uptake regulator
MSLETPSQDPHYENSRQRFRDFLTRKGLRVTSQRLAIFEAAYHHVDHFTAEELLDSARAIDRSVSRATVYRSLPILTESDMVREIDVGRDYKFYVATKGKKIDTAQIICADCDKIYEMEAPFLEWYANSIAAKVGLVAESQRLQVYARCPSGDNCDRIKGECPRESARSAQAPFSPAPHAVN